MHNQSPGIRDVTCMSHWCIEGESWVNIICSSSIQWSSHRTYLHYHRPQGGECILWRWRLPMNFLLKIVILSLLDSNCVKWCRRAYYSCSAAWSLRVKGQMVWSLESEVCCSPTQFLCVAYWVMTRLLLVHQNGTASLCMTSMPWDSPAVIRLNSGEWHLEFYFDSHLLRSVPLTLKSATPSGSSWVISCVISTSLGAATYVRRAPVNPLVNGRSKTARAAGSAASVPGAGLSTQVSSSNQTTLFLTCTHVLICLCR